ncbi:MAG: Sua5/YciO/YrdC/YwlC family protein [Candidatus Saccharibacteria bacterium GW2011_GWA2_46_10]|nr:MAG: Sua5/YciO/YrdC/YwlC family protein [Candidatus Saccharibacteria bacterium GW2011_GWA2_46_10]
MQIFPASPQAITYAIAILKLGGVVAHATETCYGLACDMTNPQAVEKLFRIKQRKPSQPVSALFPSIVASREWVEWCEEALTLAKKELPGPLTIVLPAKKEKLNMIYTAPKWKVEQPSPRLRPSRSGKWKMIGIRVSSHPVAMELAKFFGKPISTTSANVSGNQPTYSVQNIIDQFQQPNVKTCKRENLKTCCQEVHAFPLISEPDLIIDSGELEKRPPSRVIIFENGKVKTLRAA